VSSSLPKGRFPETNAAVKTHALLDWRGSIPLFVEITDGNFHDVNIIEALIPEPGSFNVVERAYLDHEQPHLFAELLAFLSSEPRRIVSSAVTIPAMLTEQPESND
jgi:hypothetical protein